MSGHELSSIQGLEDKHLRALARQGVTDLRGLVEADLEVIYRGTANLRPRPPRGLIARWQDDASNLLAEASGADDSEPDASEADASVAVAPGPVAPGPDASGWQTAASFVVIFSQRRAGETWERQVEAERTEVEPELNTQIWSGWDARPICEWMVGQLGQAGSHAATADGTDDAADEAGPTGPADEAAGPPAEAAGASRAALHIDSATIIDAAGRVNVLATSPAWPGQGACRAGAGGVHGPRRAAIDAAAGGRPRPGPRRTRLERRGSAGGAGFRPGGVRPCQGAGGRIRRGPDRVGTGCRGEAGVRPGAEGNDPSWLVTRSRGLAEGDAGSASAASVTTGTAARSSSAVSALEAPSTSRHRLARSNSAAGSRSASASARGP